MKTIMIFLAFLTPVMSSEYGNDPERCPTCNLYLKSCAAIKKLYDAWYAKGATQRYFESRLTWSECRKGGKRGNPERTDPNYLAWKHLFRQYLISEEFDVLNPSEYPNEYKEVREECPLPTRDYMTRWTDDHVARDYARCGKFARDISHPPPEMFGTDLVDKKTGCSVDQDGNLDPTGGGVSDMLKYLIFPFVLAVIVSLYFKSKGQNGPLFGVISIVLYAWLTDPWMVAGHFFGVYMIVAYAIIFAFAGGIKLVMSIVKS